jgi:AAA15 family ATPase/GTPase
MKSLSVRNFKNIGGLDLNGLERVNLFTGKNNTGKSTLLEAIAIFVNDGNTEVITDILNNRGELSNLNLRRLNEEEIFRALSSLFTNNEVDFYSEEGILISENKNSFLRIRIVKYFSKIIKGQDDSINHRQIIVSKYKNIEEIDSEISLGLVINENSNLIPLSRVFKGFPYNRGIGSSSPKVNFRYVNSSSSNIEENSVLWDNITLTEKENYVIQGLRIIEPLIERIAFIGESKRDRSAVVKMKGQKQVLSLNSMGDGINRVLSIILSAVNVENGFLLIDEFENGLYHSVQEQLWEIIFELSSVLNFQVFATTHSNDCIDGFENILNDGKDNRSGKLFRLERKGHFIKNVEFDSDELRIATNANIEIR